MESLREWTERGVARGRREWEQKRAWGERVLHDRVVDPLRGRAAVAQRKAVSTSYRVARVLGMLLLVVFLLAGVVLSAMFLYTTLYVLLIPVPPHEQSMYLDYTMRPVTAVGNFTAPYGPFEPVGEHFLAREQTYMIYLTLDLPETDANRAVGTFMASIDLLTVDGAVIASATRPCMVRHKSSLMQHIFTIAYAVPALLGLWEEAQSHTLEVFPYYREQSEMRLARARVTLSDPAPHVYAATVSIEGLHFGVRWVMQHWFLTSAVFGITTIANLEVLVVLLLWQRFASAGKSERVATREAWAGVVEHVRHPRPAPAAVEVHSGAAGEVDEVGMGDDAAPSDDSAPGDFGELFAQVHGGTPVAVDTPLSRAEEHAAAAQAYPVTPPAASREHVLRDGAMDGEWHSVQARRRRRKKKKAPTQDAHPL